jgi:hypothetical protein
VYQVIFTCDKGRQLSFITSSAAAELQAPRRNFHLGKVSFAAESVIPARAIKVDPIQSPTVQIQKLTGAIVLVAALLLGQFATVLACSHGFVFVEL